MKKPTAEDWVIARVLMVAFDGGANTRVRLNYDFVRAALYLTQRVGMERIGEMFAVLREERRAK